MDQLKSDCNTLASERSHLDLVYEVRATDFFHGDFHKSRSLHRVLSPLEGNSRCGCSHCIQCNVPLMSNGSTTDDDNNNNSHDNMNDIGYDDTDTTDSSIISYDSEYSSSLSSSNTDWMVPVIQDVD